MENFWEGFWSIVREWDGMGQFVLMLVIFGTVLTIIKSAFYYANVFMHGWPPPNTPMPDGFLTEED